MTDFKEIDRMTLYEYELRQKARLLKEIDREHEIHLQAWANIAVQATKSQGKGKEVPVYKTYKQFFDYKKRVNEIVGKVANKVEQEKLYKVAVRVQEYAGRRKSDGII